jgi:hypothetical protein
MPVKEALVGIPAILEKAVIPVILVMPEKVV